MLAVNLRKSGLSSVKVSKSEKQWKRIFDVFAILYVTNRLCHFSHSAIGMGFEFSNYQRIDKLFTFIYFIFCFSSLIVIYG